MLERERPGIGYMNLTREHSSNVVEEVKEVAMEKAKWKHYITTTRLAEENN